MEKKVYELLNDQINKEFYSAYLYLDFANYYAEAGLDGKKLFAAAAGLLRDDARIRSMAESMASLGIRDATERIYDTVMSLLK